MRGDLLRAYALGGSLSLIWGKDGGQLGVFGTAGVRVWAQQNLPQTPSVLTPQGFLVEEVRVGGSCAVIVSTTGNGPRQIAALPCRN